MQGLMESMDGDNSFKIEITSPLHRGDDRYQGIGGGSRTRSARQPCEKSAAVWRNHGRQAEGRERRGEGDNAHCGAMIDFASSLSLLYFGAFHK